jgi:hypothetical protein
MTPAETDRLIRLAGDHDLVNALARDHLADHLDHLLVAWIAAGAGWPLVLPSSQSTKDPTHHQEFS